jgi:hypothetical protein
MNMLVASQDVTNSAKVILSYQQNRPEPLYLVKIECYMLVHCFKRHETNSHSQESTDKMEVLERIVGRGFPNVSSRAVQEPL